MTPKECLFKQNCRDYQTPNCNTFCRTYIELYKKEKKEYILPPLPKTIQVNQRVEVNCIPYSVRARINLSSRDLVERKAD